MIWDELEALGFSDSWFSFLKLSREARDFWAIKHLLLCLIWSAVELQLAFLPHALEAPRAESRTTASAGQRAESTASSSKPMPRTEYAPQK
jgi:hypothetical protein